MRNIFISFLLFTLNVFGYININPVTFDKKIDNKGDIQEYTLYNPTQQPLKYHLYLTDKDIEWSMKNWIEIYPTTVTLKPGRSEKFKILVKAPSGTPKGEYLVTLGIKEISLPKLGSKNNTAVNVLTHLKMDLAGYVGELNPKIFLKDFSMILKNNTLNFNGEIANIGERRGTLDFYIAENQTKNQIYIGNIRLLKGEKIEASKLNQKLTKYDDKLIKNFSKYNTLIVRDSLNKKIIYENKIK